MKFTPIPIFTSNYVWVIEHTEHKEAYIVDPGRAEEVNEYLTTKNLTLKGVLVTHSHNDHIGGINQMATASSSTVYGPYCEGIPQVSRPLIDGDQFELWPATELCPAINAEVMHLPGHLPEHIVFLISMPSEPPALFCGDVLFSSGCGRMFSGPANTYKASLDRIAKLPSETHVYCAHEYTINNLEFAKYIEPKNKNLDLKNAEITDRLARHQCSLPSTIGSELLTNPFLRTKSKELLSRLEELTGHYPHDEVEAFSILRQLKDTF